MKNPLDRLRLRHKLALLLSLAALLPVGVVSWLAVGLVLGNLDRSLSEQTERQLQVGLSLVLRRVERIGADAIRLARGGELSAAMTAQPDQASPPAREASGVLDRVSAYLSPSLVQVFDRDGHALAEAAIGSVRRGQLRVPVGSAPVAQALDYESPLTIEPVGRILVVRAAAPIVDPSYRLLGAVVVSSPMDGSFADEVKSALGSEVLLFAAERALPEGAANALESPAAAAVHNAVSTFVDENGRRRGDISLAPGTALEAYARESLLGSRWFFERAYEVGYTGLVDFDRRRVGVFAVAVERAPLLGAKSVATRSLLVGALGALAFALALAGLLTRRLTGPIARLHRGALAVARGDLEQRIELSEGDEIGDLAAAFSYMIETLKENQDRLAARMREIVALHDAGRAVSSVIDLGEVLRSIIDSVAQVLDGSVCALWLVDGPGSRSQPAAAPAPAELVIGAARVNSPGVEGASDDPEAALPLSPIAAEVADQRSTLRLDRAADHARYREPALALGLTGSLLATPLERKGSVIGVLIVGRTRGGALFTQADGDLLATFANQAASAIENARLYEEVRAFNEELEGMVKARTRELTVTNQELGRTIAELRETQAQLISSERMAGLGLLVASVAHEINSPSAAIAGSVDALIDNVGRLQAHSRRLSQIAVEPAGRAGFTELVAERAPALAALPMQSAVAVRRAARGLRASLEAAGIPSQAAGVAARRMAEINAGDPLASELVALARSLPAEERGDACQLLASHLAGTVFLHRSALTIKSSIQRIQTIVRALKTYSHLDQGAGLQPSDVHEGIENTLVILHHELRDITTVKKYGELPSVPAFVDELNQVWTNLIHNAAQALQGRGEIAIETGVWRPGAGHPAGHVVLDAASGGAGYAVVRIIDDGPGIPREIIPRIFEPFFTTKPKGEGTGLGLGIVRQIVDKHHGEVTCDSRPGNTCFEVWLPLESEPGEGGARARPVPAGSARATASRAADGEPRVAASRPDSTSPDSTSEDELGKVSP